MYLIKWQPKYIVDNLLNNARRKSYKSRNFHVTPKNNAKYYDTLGLSKGATQSDIKAAYYKLSMLYHPDKNEGCENSATKFREIAEAYEVLGNFKLRKLYDKGLIHTTESSFTSSTTVTEEDDVQTKFYKARMKRSEVPHESGAQPIYDFDEWSRAHYGETFDRHKQAKIRHETRVNRDIAHMHSRQSEYLLFGLVFFIIGGIAIFSSDNDVDRVSKSKKKIRPPEKPPE